MTLQAVRFQNADDILFKEFHLRGGRFVLIGEYRSREGNQSERQKAEVIRYVMAGLPEAGWLLDSDESDASLWTIVCAIQQKRM